MPSFTIGYKKNRDFLHGFSDRRTRGNTDGLDQMTGSLRVFSYLDIVVINPITNAIDGLN